MKRVSYTVPARTGEAELRDRGSRFLAIVAPVDREEAAKGLLERLRQEHSDATHHCWAWRLGPHASERSSDDGEPSGTAGVPILRMLRGADLTDVLAVVVRWYGGTKLGKGGLARAYAGAVREALVELPTERRLVRSTVRLTVPYTAIGAVQRLIHPPELELIDEVYGADVVITLAADAERHRALIDLTASLGLTLEEVDPS
ncbi:MAG: IMPACT family protein [Thermoanaerobaculia bacterium]|nr:IMPACT family protein [Thermoanaerobaculia bacterium]